MRQLTLALMATALAALLAPPPLSCAGNETNKSVTEENLRELRKQASHRTRRLIQNNDANDIWYYCKNPTEKGFLDIWTSGLENSQVDTIFYTTQTGIGTVVHRSKIAAPMTAATGEFQQNKLAELHALGTDPLELVSKFCRNHGKEVFASFRMNDIHSGDLDADGDLLDPELHSPWKREHPEYLLGKQGSRHRFFGQSRSWAAVNYELAPVRNYVYDVIEEVCVNYDIDGVELDFNRHPLFFKSQVNEGKATENERRLMTDFVLRVRRMLDQESVKKNRPLLLAIRVPDSVGFCKDIGLDVENWLEQGLVDMLAVGDYFQLQPWRDSVELGHRYGVPVYPCLSDSRDLEDPSVSERNSLPSFRGRALQAWSSGADGIYLFNAVHMYPPQHEIYDQIGDAELIKQMSQIYFVNAMGTDIIDGFLHQGHASHYKLPELNRARPIRLNPKQTAEPRIDVGATPKGSAVLKVDIKNSPGRARVNVLLNGAARSETRRAPLGESATRITFELDPANVNSGDNVISIENSGDTEIAIIDAQICVD